eukprot:5443480-Alexandrium_andersonii.AAC.1
MVGCRPLARPWPSAPLPLPPIRWKSRRPCAAWARGSTGPTATATASPGQAGCSLSGVSTRFGTASLHPRRWPTWMTVFGP